MNTKKILIFFYKKLSKIYIFFFGRKKMQILNDLILSLSLNAKGYKNYGKPSSTGEKNFIKLIRKRLNFCIDIGANIGKYSELLIHETNSQIIAFEPLPKAFDELQVMEKKFSSRFKAYNFAIGDKNCNLDLNFGSETSELASFSKNLDKLSFVNHKNNKKIEVKVITLDTFFEKFNITYAEKGIDLLKIDTEGFELEVLRGASNTLINKIPKFIQIEYNWHQLFKSQTIYNFSEILSNYEVFQILPFGNNLVKVDPSRPESNIFHLSNFVFIRKDISREYE